MNLVSNCPNFGQIDFIALRNKASKNWFLSSLICLIVFIGNQPAQAEIQSSRSTSVSLEELIENAEQGDAQAQFELANFLIQNEGMPEKITELLTLSAQQDYLPAVTNLGINYYFGDYGEQSYELSAALFSKSAKLGDASAQYYLGLSYLNGTGVPKNEQNGVKLLMLAANAGMPYAQFELAKCFELGIGIEQNLFEAVSWYAYAAKSGLSEASERFNEIYYSTQFTNEAGEQVFFWFELEEIEKGNVPDGSGGKRLSSQKVWVEVK